MYRSTTTNNNNKKGRAGENVRQVLMQSYSKLQHKVSASATPAFIRGWPVYRENVKPPFDAG